MHQTLFDHVCDDSFRWRRTAPQLLLRPEEQRTPEARFAAKMKGAGIEFNAGHKKEAAERFIQAAGVAEEAGMSTKTVRRAIQQGIAILEEFPTSFNMERAKTLREHYARFLQ